MEDNGKIKYTKFEQNDQVYHQFGQETYVLVDEYRQGFDAESICQRYSDILPKYDFIVGDWSYEQLRIKGFFYNDCQGVPYDQKIMTLTDYLVEYCSFGCAYFILERVSGVPYQSKKSHRKEAYFKENRKKVCEKKFVLRKRES